MQHFKGSPDINNAAYNTKLGVYTEGCGLDNVLMSWGHDDYMYLVYICIFLFRLHAVAFVNDRFLNILQVAKENKTKLPSAALFIIRYHSFYGKYLYGFSSHGFTMFDCIWT